MRKSYNIAKLSFASGIHLGSGTGEEYDRSMRLLLSDTISAALCSVWAAGGNKVEPFMRSYRLSSAMPLYRGRLFLPLPPDKSCVVLEGDTDGKQHKRIKRLQWIEQPLWEELSRQGSITITADKISACGSAIAQSDADKIYIQRQSLEQKVTVVDGDDNEPYYFDRIFWGEDVGLGVLYECDQSAKADFERAFQLLADNGFGTRRTVGNGLFSVAFSEVEIDADESLQGVQLLSLWYPKAEEWNPDAMSRSCYEVVSRGGYISGSSDIAQRKKIKKSVNMIMSGAVVATRSLTGDVVDVRPDEFNAHPVWRDGRALYLPFKILYDDEV